MCEQTEIFFDTDQPCCIGVDIGTTNVCAYVLQLSNGTPTAVYRMPNASDLPSLFAGDHRQDADLLYRRIQLLLDAVMARYPRLCSIGFTGQMHGVLCTDTLGQALTPLYTWQDERAGQGTPSACDEIWEKTGYRVSAGYGLATVYALMRDRQLPIDTARICTVMDFVAAKLCGVPVIQMHTTNAASLGIYDTANQTFDAEALCKIGIRPTWLPKVSDTIGIIGRYRGIPVTLPIGDNQASFLGSVRDTETTVLANFGTGSQVSFLAPVDTVINNNSGSIELRPFPGGRHLICGSALCGGRAYALLERFFRTAFAEAGQELGEPYVLLNRLAAEGLEQMHQGGRSLSVKTTFCGTRDDPDASGSITGIREELFTPQALAVGVLRGMAEELYDMFCSVPHGHITRLAASGNAVRENPVLCQVLAEMFGMPVQIPAVQEEAAFGAAMTAAVGAGYAASVQELGGWVTYQIE